MDAEGLKELFGMGGESVFTLGDIFLSLVGSTVLSLILAYTYRKTHNGPSYSKTFLVSLFIMSVSTSIVMLIIGSNIARAFSLVGALSIIRFRTAVKDPRDTAFLFAGVVAGMGCGTGFYVPAFALTLFLSLILLLLEKYDFGSKDSGVSVVKVTTRESADGDAIQDAFRQKVRSTQLINKVQDFEGGKTTFVYSVHLGKAEADAVESAVKGVNGVTEVAVYQADQHAPF